MKKFIFYLFIELIVPFSVSSLTAQGTCTDPIPIVSQPCNTVPITILDSLNSFCFRMIETNDSYKWPEINSCHAANPNWFSFKAASDSITLLINIGQCEKGNIGGVELAIYSGNPICDGSRPENLHLLVGRCGPNSRFFPGQYEFPLNTTPGEEYYVLIDGYARDVCTIRVKFKRGEIVLGELEGKVELNDLIIPEYNGVPDSICRGANKIRFKTKYVPRGATFTLWVLPNGDTLRSGLNSIIIENKFDSTGKFKLCVAAANYHDTTAFNCKTYYIRNLSPIVETAIICEGSDYNWPYNPNIDFTSLSPGEYEFSNVVETATKGCNRKYILQLTVRDVNRENPTHIDTTFCTTGSSFTFDVNPATQKMFSTSESGTFEYFDKSPITGCDTFFNIEVTINPQAIINLSLENERYCENMTFLFKNKYEFPDNSVLFIVESGDTIKRIMNPDKTISLKSLSPGEHSFEFIFRNQFGCLSIDTMTFVVYPLPDIGFKGLNTDYCLGDKPDTLYKIFPGTFEPSSILQYQDDNIAILNPSKAGTFKLILSHSENGCFNSDTTIITINDNPELGLATEKLIRPGQSIKIGVPPEENVAYLWSNYKTTSYIYVDDPGIYALEATDTITSCYNNDTVTVNLITSTIETVQQLIQYSPNPFGDKLIIHSQDCTGEVKIISLNSTVYYEDKVRADETLNIDSHSWPAGMYFIVLPEKGSIKVIKE